MVDNVDPLDLRIGDLLSRERNRIGIIVGFPSDRGVEINGGRPGAAAGPDAIRHALYKMTPGSPEMAHLWKQIGDVGDVQIAGDVSRDQEMLAE
ncbi:MAG: arginase family protein, partial [Rhodothermia bacterium]